MCSIPYEEFYIWLYFVLTGRDYGNNRCNSPYSIETVFIMKGMEAFCHNNQWINSLCVAGCIFNIGLSP